MLVYGTLAHNQIERGCLLPYLVDMLRFRSPLPVAVVAPGLKACVCRPETGKWRNLDTVRGQILIMRFISNDALVVEPDEEDPEEEVPQDSQSNLAPEEAARTTFGTPSPYSSVMFK